MYAVYEEYFFVLKLIVVFEFCRILVFAYVMDWIDIDVHLRRRLSTYIDGYDVDIDT